MQDKINHRNPSVSTTTTKLYWPVIYWALHPQYAPSNIGTTYAKYTDTHLTNYYYTVSHLTQATKFLNMYAEITLTKLHSESGIMNACLLDQHSMHAQTYRTAWEKE